MRILSATALLLMAQYAFAAPLDTAHSQIGFTLTQMSSPMDGEFKHFSGNATLDLKHANTGRADITISTASIHLPTAQANSMAQSSDWFNVAKFPSAHFVASSIKPLGGNRYQFNGTLTIKGVTKPVTLKLLSFQCMPHPMMHKDACGATATTTIKRSEFNAGKYAPYVSDDVVLTIPVESVKQ